MKLFYYCPKNEQVLGELDLGELNDKEVKFLEKVIEFLNEQKITDGRYKALELAEKYVIRHRYGEQYIRFE